LSKNQAPLPTLRELIKKHRDDLGVTQAALAKQAELTGGMISQVELGQRNLSRDSIDRVATTLRLTPTERNALYVAREAAADRLSERKPKGFDPSFALGLAEIDDELAALGGHDDPGSADRRSELYAHRDRITSRARETEASSISARLAMAEARLAEFANIHDRLVFRIDLLEQEVERVSLDHDETVFRDAQRRSSTTPEAANAPAETNSRHLTIIDRP
jgi:transcriptional regulator with XRE-family HTH domain